MPAGETARGKMADRTHLRGVPRRCRGSRPEPTESIACAGSAWSATQKDQDGMVQVGSVWTIGALVGRSFLYAEAASSSPLNLHQELRPPCVVSRALPRLFDGCSWKLQFSVAAATAQPAHTTFSRNMPRRTSAASERGKAVRLVRLELQARLRDTVGHHHVRCGMRCIAATTSCAGSLRRSGQAETARCSRCVLGRTVCKWIFWTTSCSASSAHIARYHPLRACH